MTGPLGGGDGGGGGGWCSDLHVASLPLGEVWMMNV